jgi:hypothetical protein
MRTTVSFRILKLPSPGRMVELLPAPRQPPTRDVSRTGMGFSARLLLLPGTLLEIQVPRSPARPGGRARASVVWCRETALGEYAVGVRFLRRSLAGGLATRPRQGAPRPPRNMK